ncbi:hypothetical protein [Actinopolymorpha alba]|uniref:hypothetical protein n=1 Tax=Actinopolymorpha alba TaxID=533267 RepID=UPI0003600EFA|nr:hypothetical protein [Actinopolymorpha alba]
MSVFDQPTFEVDTLDDLNHIHDEDCRDCGRIGCGHLSCDHIDGQDDCNVPGCDCARWLADGDCAVCDGRGVISVDYETGTGRVLESDMHCRECGSTGTKAMAAARWYR